MKLYYHHVGLAGAREDFKKTVFSKVPLSFVDNNVDDANPVKHEMLEVLNACFPDGQFNCWGVPSGAGNIINNLNTGDAVLLVESITGDGRVPALCIVTGFWKEEFRELSKALWGDDKYPYIFFFHTVNPALTWKDLLAHLEYKPKWDPRGKFLSVSNDKLNSFGGAKEYIKFLRGNYADSLDILESVITDDVENELGILDEEFTLDIKKAVLNIKHQSRSETPDLTEGVAVKIKNITGKPRSAAFRISVKKLYGFKCAVCGLCLLSADGKPALESAHLFPKELDGSDDFRNGICLCKMHHWALDSGWIAIGDDYKIIVRNDLPLSVEYDFIRHYDGQKIKLPGQMEFSPHPIFLQAHRKLNGFE